ncbi:streptogramin lyase [Nocardia transvalensis]|uniref:Streptogramin lyase n=1 Tax=Nocardia transvalensis TaxID=37333 RepID=A0A7W9PBS8_9NOCA|nr:hypothetical protein [Nocardia transvalensis]MBB5912773.1 streptogramin lyase [Nocardia transvalensis]
MTIRRISLLAALPALATMLISGATAGADDVLEAPVMEEVFSVPGTVSAKFHNPNDRGVCWVYNDDTGEIFGGDNPTSYAIPDGKMVQTSLGNGALPAGVMRVRGACAFDRPTGNHDYASTTDVITVEVTGKPSTGSF